MKVEELKPYQKKIDLIVKAIEKNDAREVVSKLDDSKHRVTEALVGDETGCILLTLWDEAIEQVEAGKTYKLENGYTQFFKNSLRLNIGRFGKFEESSDKIEEANRENNLSEKEMA